MLAHLHGCRCAPFHAHALCKRATEAQELERRVVAAGAAAVMRAARRALDGAPTRLVETCPAFMYATVGDLLVLMLPGKRPAWPAMCVTERSGGGRDWGRHAALPDLAHSEVECRIPSR